MENLNRRLKRILDDIQTAEEKIVMWQEHLRELNIQKEQMEDKEIIKSIRSLKLGSREMLAVLDQIQNGRILFTKEDADRICMATQDQEGEAGRKLSDPAEEEKIMDGERLEREDEESEKEN